MAEASTPQTVRRENLLLPLIHQLRLPHWSKNLLLFLPVLAAHAFQRIPLARAGLGFLVFCLVASAVYVLNDLRDLDTDRHHPRPTFCCPPF